MEAIIEFVEKCTYEELANVGEKERKGILYYYEWAALIALEIMLAFSAWGYIRLDYVSITFVPLIVLATAYLLGPCEGMVAGVIFALTGMWKATIVTSDIAVGDLLFSPFRSGKPMQSVLLCMVPRIMLGLVAGLLYKKAKNAKKYKPLWIALSTVVAQLTHVLLVFGMMQAFFPESGVAWWSPIRRWHKIGVDIELIASVAAVVVLAYCYESTWVKNTIDKIREGILANKYTKVIYWQWSALILIAACGFSVSWNLKNGINEIVMRYDIVPGETSLDVLWSLIMQFIVAQLALFVLIGIMQSLIYYYYASAEVRSRMDLMTGAFNRTMLIQTMTHDLKNLKKGQRVLFIMMDVDYFKQINDTYGHDFGDQVLISLVHILRRNFAGDAMVGRMGGDEFCVYCRHEEIERRLPNIMEQVTREFDKIVVPGDRIGVLNFSYGVSWGKLGMEFEEVYKLADQDLYEHKHIRRQYVDNSKGNV